MVDTETPIRPVSQVAIFENEVRDGSYREMDFGKKGIVCYKVDRDGCLVYGLKRNKTGDSKRGGPGMELFFFLQLDGLFEPEKDVLRSTFKGYGIEKVEFWSWV